MLCRLLLSVSLCLANCSALDDTKDDILNYSSMVDPFRMQKINLVWEKARVHMNLTELKLSKLYSQLKVQDKEELTLKKLKAEGGDKDGLRETDVRTRFSLILSTYGMGGSNPQPQQPISLTDQIFKDKKLQRLWEKAEKSGLTSTELLELQQQFQHHQQKVDEFQQLMELAGNKDNVKYNTIHREIENEVFQIRDTNELKKKMTDLKSGFDRLHRLSTNQGEENGFVEPKVAGLWKIALKADFDDVELESLREELSHYERRLEKLRFLQNELKLVDERFDAKHETEEDDEKSEGRQVMDRKLAKNIDSVKKLHDNLENKILSRHAEL